MKKITIVGSEKKNKYLSVRGNKKKNNYRRQGFHYIP
jgi:hypothetical protein